MPLSSARRSRGACSLGLAAPALFYQLLTSTRAGSIGLAFTLIKYVASMNTGRLCGT